MLGDEWPHHPVALPEGVDRHDLFSDAMNVLLPAGHALGRRTQVPLAELAGEAWVTGGAGTGWEEMTVRTCRELGGFDPDVRHNSNDPTIVLAIVGHGLGVAMLPDLPLPSRAPGVAVRPIAEGPVSRAILAATRTADASRPSTQALLAAVREAADAV